jgi:hypothetical protein
MSTEPVSLKFRAVKALDISYLTVLSFVFGVTISLSLDKAFGTFDPEKADKKNIALLMLEIVGHVCLLGVIIYIMRNVLEKIPSPLEGVQGLQHKKLKELGTASVFIFFLMFYQKHLIAKMDYVYNRISKK